MLLSWILPYAVIYSNRMTAHQHFYFLSFFCPCNRTIATNLPAILSKMQLLDSNTDLCLLLGMRFCKTKKRRKEIKLRAKYFKKRFMEQKSTDKEAVHNTKLFTMKELKKATDNFRKNRVPWEGGQGGIRNASFKIWNSNLPYYQKFYFLKFTFLHFSNLWNFNLNHLIKYLSWTNYITHNLFFNHLNNILKIKKTQKVKKM